MNRRVGNSLPTRFNPNPLPAFGRTQSLCHPIFQAAYPSVHNDDAIAAIFAAPGLKQAEALRYTGDFRKAYQAAKEAGDLEAAKQILELAKQAPKSPNRLESLSSTEKLICSKSDFQRIDFSGHVFSGEVKRGGKTVVGGHSLVSGQVREIPNSSTKPNAVGVYEAKIEVWDAKVGRWVPKTNNGGISTMFPKSWDGARIKNEVEHAFANKTISIELRGRKTYSNMERHYTKWCKS